MSIIELNPIETTAKQWPVSRTIWTALGLSAALWGLIIFAWFIISR